MMMGKRLGLVLSILLCSALGLAQQRVPDVPLGKPDLEAGAHSRQRGIFLDVVVTPKNGAPVAGLVEQDFTVLDNKVPQKITSFQAMGGSASPVEVIIVIDAINTTYSTVAYERGELNKFLLANGGKLAYPTALAVVTDTNAQLQNSFSTDGNRLSAAFDHYAVGIRQITRSTGFYGAGDRMALSLKALHELAARESTVPGRKLVLWISPGWPLLSGPGVLIDKKQEDTIFSHIISLSTDLRQARITLYSVDPLGTADAGGSYTFYYQNFLKGVRKSTQTQFGNLALQVLATQTGGLVLNASNDLAGLIKRAVDDAGAYYELSFDPVPGEPNEYHQIEVKVAKPGLVARTRTGYYSQP